MIIVQFNVHAYISHFFPLYFILVFTTLFFLILITCDSSLYNIITIVGFVSLMLVLSLLIYWDTLDLLLCFTVVLLWLAALAHVPLYV